MNIQNPNIKTMFLPIETIAFFICVIIASLIGLGYLIAAMIYRLYKKVNGKGKYSRGVSTSRIL